MVGNIIRLDCDRGVAKRDIAEIPNRLLEGAEQAILEAAHLMSGLAKVYVRVDTGSLRDSIRVERTAPTRHNHRQVRVRAGGYIVNPDTGKLVDYAVVVEVKYPYMKPAWYEVRSQVERIINRICLDEVARLESVSV